MREPGRGSSCRSRSSQRHTAHSQLFEITVRYRFHPRHGERLSVVRQHGFRGERTYVVQQRDGTLTHLPVWMTEEAAAELNIVSHPRLPRETWMELRRITDAALSSPVSQAQRGGGGERNKTAATEPSRRRAHYATPNRSRRKGVRTACAVADRDHSHTRRRKTR